MTLFVELRIFSILEGTAAIIYHPKGPYGDKIRTDGLTAFEALEKARGYNAPICANMLFCCEWSHTFVMHSSDYTEAQKAKFKADDLAVPGIRALYELDTLKSAIDFLAQIPQVLRFR